MAGKSYKTEEDLALGLWGPESPHVCLPESVLRIDVPSLTPDMLTVLPQGVANPAVWALKASLVPSLFVKRKTGLASEPGTTRLATLDYLPPVPTPLL